MYIQSCRLKLFVDYSHRLFFKPTYCIWLMVIETMRALLVKRVNNRSFWKNVFIYCPRGLIAYNTIFYFVTISKVAKPSRALLTCRYETFQYGRALWPRLTVCQSLFFPTDGQHLWPIALWQLIYKWHRSYRQNHHFSKQAENVSAFCQIYFCCWQKWRPIYISF